MVIPLFFGFVPKPYLNYAESKAVNEPDYMLDQYTLFESEKKIKKILQIQSDAKKKIKLIFRKVFIVSQISNKFKLDSIFYKDGEETKVTYIPNSETSNN